MSTCPNCERTAHTTPQPDLRYFPKFRWCYGSGPIESIEGVEA